MRVVDLAEAMAPGAPGRRHRHPTRREAPRGADHRRREPSHDRRRRGVRRAARNTRGGTTRRGGSTASRSPTASATPATRTTSGLAADRAAGRRCRDPVRPTSRSTTTTSPRSSAVLRGDWLTQGPAVARVRGRRSPPRSGPATPSPSPTAPPLSTARLRGAGSAPAIVVATSALTFSASAAVPATSAPTFASLDIDPIDAQPRPDGGAAERRRTRRGALRGPPVDLSAPRPPTAGRHRGRRPRARAHARPIGPVGNCAHSDLCCFSFHPVKTITTGEGGMVTTNADELAARLRRVPDPRHRSRRPEHGGWYYEIDELGYNYRLTDIQAALGLQPAPQARTDSSPNATSMRLATTERLGDAPVRAPAGRARWHGFTASTSSRCRWPIASASSTPARGGHRRAGALRADAPPPACTRNGVSVLRTFRTRRRPTRGSSRCRCSPASPRPIRTRHRAR